VPLDVFVVRKLGVPGHREVAMGAIASGGVRVLNDDVVSALGIAPETIEAVIAKEWEELTRRERVYRGDRPPPLVKDRTVIVVDDGLATGATMRAAMRAMRELGAAKIVVAAPVAAVSTCEELGREADECVCAITPDPFYAVGLWYENFTQTADDEIHKLLRRPVVPGAAVFGLGCEGRACEERRGARAPEQQDSASEEGEACRTDRAPALPESGPGAVSW